ncbi:MAG: YafY family transcriptional regulator [Clostridiales bacterium]|nr:YafY family transcriptional regulator [Clostridiales bacterium]
MKIERLISIIIILLQNKKVTASYLSEKFNVSKRTIYRDINDICLAGIPVITLAGTDGGIMIEDDYKIDKTLFTEKELQAIFTGLLSLDSVTLDNKYQNIIDKFFDKNNTYVKNHILINLSSHYKGSLAPKIQQIQQSIESLHKIEFDYYNVGGKKRKIIEPYLIVFQWSNWYILGYEENNNEFRMYKLNRLWNLQITEQSYKLRDVPKEKLDFNQYFTDEIHPVIFFDESVKYRLIEEYGIDCYTDLDNGKLRFEVPFTNKEYLIQWVLSFGDKAEIIEPAELRLELKRIIENNLEKYS